MKTKRFPPTFVDRVLELKTMELAMEKTKDKKGSTILITGDVGVGKTRLAEEFAEFCESKGFIVLSSFCLGNDETAYFPVLTALENYAKKVREKGEGCVPLGLAGFQALEVEERTPNGLTKERTRMLEYLLKQFVEIARKQAVLFWVDDLHLADSATLAFFHYLSRNVRKERILVVATYVEEYASANTVFAKTLRNMSIERMYTTLRLGNFSERETECMVKQFGFENAKEVGKYIHERTSGNPFFVVEFLAALRAGNVKEMEAIKKMVVPESVKGLIKLRISRLSEKAMKVLMACAILGKAFEYQALKRLVELTEEELLDALDELRDRHILVECHEFEEGYRFVSNTVHEVVCGETSRMRKKLLHQKAGKILEEMHRNDERFWNTLATHYREGGNREKFIEYGVKAGRAAARRFANTEAIEFLEEVVEMLGNTQEEVWQKVEILGDLAEVLELEGRFDEAIEMLDRRTGLILGNAVETGKTHIKKAEIYIYKGDYERALIEIENGAKKLPASNAELELAMAWSTKGYVYERIGDYRNAIEMQERAKIVFEKVNATKELGNALNRIGGCYWYLGEYEKALQWFNLALAIREKAGDLRGIAVSYNNIGIVYHDKGEFDNALEFHKKSLEILEKIGDVSGIAASYNNVGNVYHDKGEFDNALEFHKKSLEIKEKIGDTWGIGISYNNIGSVYTDKGEYDNALEFYKKSLEITEKIGDIWGIAASYNNIGWVYLEKGDFELGIEFLQKSLAFAKEKGEKITICNALFGIVICYVGLKNFVAANKTIEEAKGVVEELCLKPFEAKFLYVSGLLLTAEGKIAEAETVLKKAIEIYEGTGNLVISYYKAIFELGKVCKDKALQEKALAFFERSGNNVWAAKVRREMESGTQ
ncbi:MAG: tetratricopeptide repeat protein [Thermoplasmata archaeon]